MWNANSLHLEGEASSCRSHLCPRTPAVKTHAYTWALTTDRVHWSHSCPSKPCAPREATTASDLGLGRELLKRDLLGNPNFRVTNSDLT